MHGVAVQARLEPNEEHQGPDVPWCFLFAARVCAATDRVMAEGPNKLKGVGEWIPG